MRVAFVHPGLHRVLRGSEVAFQEVAQQLSRYDNVEVSLFGSGQPWDGTPYDFQHVGNVPREKFETGWPTGPIFRNDCVYEELTFVNNLRKVYQPESFDVTVTCSFPFVNWFLKRKQKKNTPSHVYVTQNSDHPAVSNQSEYRFFYCDGLVCTNPEYFERNQDNWNCTIITNGVDPDRFHPGPVDRAQFDLPKDAPVALIVSALIPSKRVITGIQAAAKVEGLHLVVCGDGPEREAVLAEGTALMGDRFSLKRLSYEQMPDMYRAADFLMHFSLDEPFGNIYLEALATGLPIVAHDREVTHWIVEENAVLVDSTDPANIVAGISEALNRRDEQAIAARVALVQKRFTWQIIGQQYYDFLSQVVSNR